MQNVAIFWDYENLVPPSAASGYNIANNIRILAQAYGSVKSWKAYLDITDQKSSARAFAMRSELQTSGVSLIDCPQNGRKEVVNKMIIVDMLAYAIDNPAPSVIVLISGNRDFAYPLSILRNRCYQVVLVAALSDSHLSLTSQASVCFDWQNDIVCSGAPPSSAPNSNSNPSTRLDEGTVPTLSSTMRSGHIALDSHSYEPVSRPTDHGDFLHYLRASLQPVRGLAGIPEAGQKDLRVRSSLNAAPTAEVELNAPPTSPNTNALPRSDNFGRPTCVTNTSSRSVQGRLLDVPSETEKSTDDHGAVRPTRSPILSTTNFEARISPTSPTIGISTHIVSLPSLMSPPHGMVQNASVSQDTFSNKKVDVSEDGMDNVFIYDTQPLSDPYATPFKNNSPIPHAPVGFPSSSEMTSSAPRGISSAAWKEYANQPSADPILVEVLQEAPGSPTIPNLPGILVDETEDVNTTTDMLPLETDFATIPPPTATNTGTTPSAHEPQIQTPVTLRHFKILVDILKAQLASGVLHPPCSVVVPAIYRHRGKRTYVDAGVKNWGKYAQLAEEAGIIERGGDRGEKWVALKPAHY